MVRSDPGDCLICGAAHCSCGGGPIEVVQLPARDAASRPIVVPLPPLQATAVQASLPAGTFTTATYRGTKKKRGPAAAP
jgi:hypothetical protein